VDDFPVPVWWGYAMLLAWRDCYLYQKKLHHVEFLKRVATWNSCALGFVAASAPALSGIHKFSGKATGRAVTWMGEK